MNHEALQALSGTELKDELVRQQIADIEDRHSRRNRPLLPSLLYRTGKCEMSAMSSDQDFEAHMKDIKRQTLLVVIVGALVGGVLGYLLMFR